MNYYKSVDILLLFYYLLQALCIFYFSVILRKIISKIKMRKKQMANNKVLLLHNSKVKMLQLICKIKSQLKILKL